MDIENIISVIQQFAPPHAAAPWDCSGLQCISKNHLIKKMAVCLDASPSVVQEAINKGAQFILAHHPLALKPRMLIKADNYYNTISLLIKNDIWLYSAHTSLDANPKGPVNFLAKFFELTDLTILDPTKITDGVVNYGFGIAGNLPKISTLQDIIGSLGEFLQLKTLVLCGPGKMADEVKRLAYCTGSGSNIICKAEECNCDIFISGDIKYHDALDSTIPVFDVGHFSMEEKMMEIFCNELTLALPELDIFFIPSKSPMHTIVLTCQEKDYE